MPIVPKDLQPTEMPAAVASPVNTYAPPGPSQASQFLEGLNRVLPQAQKFGANIAEDTGDSEEEQARLKALTADPKELRAEIASGNYYGLGGTRAQIAMKVMDAQNRVYGLSADLDGMAQRGELVGPDVHQKIAAAATAASSDLTDPLAIKAFTKGLAPVMAKYGQAAAHANVQEAEANKQAQLFGYMTSLHDQVDRDALDTKMDAAGVQEAHKKALYRTADYAKNNLLMSPAEIEGVLGKVAQHYAATGNVAALNAIGGYDRSGAPLKDRYGPQWDAWTKAAEAKQDSDRKKSVNDSVDGLEAQALRADGKPEDFFKAVEAAKAKDPANFPEATAERLKQRFNDTVTRREALATKQLAAQQEAAVERDYVEKGAQALIDGNGYALPEQTRFKAADGVDRTYKRGDYTTQMYDRASALLDDQAKKDGWTPEQTAAAKVRLYGQNGDVHPVYQSSFNDLFNSARSGAAPNPQTLPQRLAQLEFVRTQDPSQFLNMADKQSSKPGVLNKQELWLTTYKAAREYGSEPEAAFAIANQRVFAPGALDRITAKDVDENTDAVLKKLGVSGPVARQAVTNAVQLQIAAGVRADDITKKAVDAFNRSHISVNGVPATNHIPGVGDPVVAGEYLSDAAKFYKFSNPNFKAQPFDIAFTDDPAKPGNYIAVRTDTMERISRVGITGDRLKDFVLQWREKSRQDPNLFPTAAQSFRTLGHDLGKSIKRQIGVDN